MKKLTSSKYVNLLAFACSGVYFVSYLTRINYNAVIQAIITDMGISKTTASLAATGTFLTYGIGQLISGYLGDKVKPHHLIAYGLCTTSLVNFIMPLLDYRFMIAAWCVNGLAQAMMWPPIVKILTNLLNENDYKRNCIKTSWGSSLATIAVYLASPGIVNLFSWRAVFTISAIIAALSVFPWLRLYKHIESKAEEVCIVPEKPTVSEKIEKRKFPVLLLIFLGIPIIFQGLLRDGVTTWMPSYISDNYNVSDTISILTGVILPCFGILWYYITSFINRRLIKNELLCCSALFALGLLCTVILKIFMNSSIITSVISMALLSGSMHGVNLIQTSFICPYFAKYGNVSFISGALNACTYIGSAFSTYVVALITDNFGWSITILIWMAATLAGGAVAFIEVAPWKKFKKEN